MPDYLVTWEIDADEIATPLLAAQKARAAQVKPGTWATVFDVTDKATGAQVRIDLSDEET